MQNKKQVLLTFNNARTTKGENIIDTESGLPYKTAILYLSAFKQNSKGINICSHASKGCAESCLVGSGHGGMIPQVFNGRVKKTEYFLSNRVDFLFQLKEEIEKNIKKFEGKNKLVIRLNGTSDLTWEKFKVFEGGKNIFEVFENLTFYDYTKNWTRFDKVLPSNYHLTFSRSETNEAKAIELLKRGFNVAMVFTKLPETYKGFKVINADENDLRFLDEKNVICGLKFKKLTGKGGGEKNIQAIKNGFVINTTDIGESMLKYNKGIKRMSKKLETELV